MVNDIDIEIDIVLTDDKYLPVYQTEGAVAADLYAAIKEPLLIRHSSRALVPTGVKVAIPPGFEAQVRSRSGSAIKSGLMVLNSPGTIDQDFRGEIGVILLNTGQYDITINPGDRIAQLAVTPVVRASFKQVKKLKPTQRGAGGFGSTGL